MYRVNKVGVSAVVATVLIIMITVAAVGIVWAVVIPMIKDNLGSSSSCKDADISIISSQGYTCHDSAQKIVAVQIKKGSNDVNVSGLKFYLSSGGSSVCYRENIVLDKNSYTTFYLNATGISDSSIGVVPIIRSENILKECSKISVEEIKNCSLGYVDLSNLVEKCDSNVVSLPLLPSLPSLQVDSPVNNSAYITNSVWLNVSSDQSVNWFYSLNGASNVSFSPNISLPPLVNGNYNVILYVNNSNGIVSKFFNFSVNAPIGFDSVASELGVLGSKLITVPTVVSSNNNRMLVVGVSSRGSTGNYVSGVKYNGVSMTSIYGFNYYNNTEGYKNFVSLWYLLEPDIGTYNTVISFKESLPNIANYIDGAAAGVISLYNVKQQAPEAFNFSNRSVSGSQSTSITTISPNSLVVDVVATTWGGPYMNLGASSNQVRRWHLSPIPSGSSSTRIVSVPQTVSMDWSSRYGDSGFSSNWGQVVAAFAPA